MAKQIDNDFLLQLRPLPNWPWPAEQRLRAALKRLLRDHGLRCVSAKPVQPETKALPGLTETNQKGVNR